MTKGHAIPTGRMNNESEPKSGFIVGSGNRKGGNQRAAQKHDGMVMGGSITSKRATVSEQSINRLASNRSDGRVI